MNEVEIKDLITPKQEGSYSDFCSLALNHGYHEAKIPA